MKPYQKVQEMISDVSGPTTVRFQPKAKATTNGIARCNVAEANHADRTSAVIALLSWIMRPASLLLRLEVRLRWVKAGFPSDSWSFEAPMFATASGAGAVTGRYSRNLLVRTFRLAG